MNMQLGHTGLRPRTTPLPLGRGRVRGNPPSSALSPHPALSPEGRGMLTTIRAALHRASTVGWAKRSVPTRSREVAFRVGNGAVSTPFAHPTGGAAPC